MSRIHNSIEIAKRSWGVLRSDSHLIALPAMAVAASLVASVAFAGLGFVVPGGIAAGDGTTSSAAGPMIWVLVVIFYFVEALIATYFLAALVGAADVALRGGKPSLGDAFRIVNGRFGRIVQWAVITATVSVILSLIRSRLGFVGVLIAGLIGGAWEILTFLTVPVILEEDLGPINALKRSGSLFKQTWGENLVAQLGLGALGVLVMLPAFLIGALAVVVGQAVVTIVGLAVAFVWIVVAGMVISALSGIYRAALYRFAADGQIPVPFEGIDFQQAFRQKKSSKVTEAP